MDNELELVVQRMVEAGEPEDNIALVIQQWPKKDQEVDSQGSAPTSQTYGQQLSSSEEPSSVEPRNEVVGLPSPKIEGTFREGWEGRWTYDPTGYENYELPESVYRDVFGGDRQRAVEYFSKNMPNVLVHLPTEENVTLGTQNIINYETAVPADLEQLTLEEQLASIDPNTLTPEDRLSYDMVAAVNNLIKNNARGQRPATPEERKLLRAREHGERLAESDRDRGVFNTFIGTPIGSVIEGAGREGTRLLAGVLGIPELANDLLAGAINSTIGLFGGDPETIPTWEQTYGETPIDKARNYMLGAVERGMEKNAARTGDLGIWESIQAGNIDAAANKLADGLGGILPFTAMLVATGGGGASLMLGTGAVAAGQYTELKDLPMSQEARLLNATINGIAETGTEMLGNKVIIEPLRAAIRNGAGDMATSALTKAFQKVVGKFYPLAAPATEMATEAANLVIGNITAKETGEDPNRNPADGLADVLITSGVFAGGTQAMTSALTRINNSTNLKAAVKLNNQNRDIAVALEDPELSDSERVALEEMYSKNMDTINSYILEEQDRKGKLSPEQQRIVEDMEGQKDRLTELLLSEKAPESVKQSAQGEIDAINEEIDNLIAQGEQTDDTQDQAGVSSEVGEGQEPLQTQPDQSAGQEEAPTGGVLQAQEEVTPREVSEADRTVFGQAATPEQNVAANRASYERLTEGMTQEQIDADPDLVRMREQIGGTTEGATTLSVQESEGFMEPEQAQVIGVNDLGETVYSQKPESGEYAWTTSLIDGEAVDGYTAAVNPKPITKYNSLKVFTNELPDGGVMVTDADTGFGIIRGNNRRDAIAKLDNLIRTKGGEPQLLEEIRTLAQQRLPVRQEGVQQSSQFMNREQTDIVNTEDPAIVSAEGNELILPTPTQDRLQRIQSRRDEIRQRLRSKLGTLSAGVNPEVFGDLVELGATYIEEGIVRFGEFARRLREDYGRNLTDRQVREIYNESATSLGYRVRGFIQSAQQSPDVSSETKLEIEENTAPLYQAQVIRELTEEVAQLTESEKVAEVQRLSTVTGELNKDNNRAVLAGIDLINQYEAEGRHEEAAAIIDSMAKSATVMGQLIRQYGEFKSSTPAGFLHIVERWVNEVGRELTPRNRERLAELYSAYQVAANGLQQAQQTLSNEFNQANRRAVYAAEIALENAHRNMSDYIIDIKGKDTGSVLAQILQGNLLTFKSLVINPFANAVELGVRLSRESVSSLIDMAVSAIVGVPRVKTFPLSPETLRLSGRATVEGWKRAVRKSVRGSDATELSKYDISSRLTPFKAMQRLINSYKLQDFKDEFTYTGWDRFNDVLEATIGIPANTALRGLPFGDDPFYQQARVSKLIQIAKRQKGLKGQDVERFVYNPDSESAEIADSFGRAATFQDKTWLATNVRNLMSNAEGAVNRFIGGGKVANSVAKLLSRATIPFINTPSSILMKTIRFAVPFFPMANAVKAVHDIKVLASGKLPLEEKRKRMPALREKLYDSVAETAISFAMVYFAKTLVMEGLVSGDAPDEPERAKERQFMFNTMPPNTINISGFKRWVAGEDASFQQGDRVISYIPFGIPGALLGIVERTQGNKLREKKKQEKELTSAGEPIPADDTGIMDFFGEYTANLPASLQYFMNQSFVQSTGALFQTLSETDGRAFGTQMVRTLSNLGIPNSVSQSLRAGNDYMRLIYTDDMVETWGNMVAEKAGAVDDLPIRYDLWGRPVPQSPPGTNPYFFQMVDIFRTQKIIEDELTYKVFDLYTKTKDTSVIPSNIRDYYKQGDFTVRLTPEEKSELSRIVGEERAKYAERAMRGYNKDTAKPELYVKKLAKAYQQGATKGKKIFKRELMLRNREK